MKKFIIIFVLIIAIIAASAIFLSKTQKNAWACQNGEWVKLGDPETAYPDRPCVENEVEGGQESAQGLETKLSVYFLNSNLDPAITCVKAFPVERVVPKTPSVGKVAIEELVKGPTEKEISEGYSTTINKNAILQKLTIENGVAKADFNETLDGNIGGSCRVTAIRTQIIETLRQFPNIKDVIISINGNSEDILQP